MQLVDFLYAAATDCSEWRNFLEAASRAFGAQAANLLRVDEVNPLLSMSLNCGFDHVDIDTQTCLTRRQVELRRELRRSAHSLRYPDKPIFCTDGSPAKGARATRIYRKVLQSAGVEHSLTVQYSDAPELFTALSFFRRPQQAPFSSSEMDRLGALVPHLRRALAIQSRVCMQEKQAQPGYLLLDTLRVGIVILTPQGRVNHANVAARTLFSLDDGIHIAGETLVASRNRDQEALRAALLAASDTSRHQAIRVERPSGRRAFQILVMRLTEPGRAALPNLHAQPCLAMFISDPDQALETNTDLLRRMFSVTEMETRVLERITAGRSPEEVATDLSIGISTARSHLRALFTKTCTFKQSDLVQKALRSPAYLARV